MTAALSATRPARAQTSGAPSTEPPQAGAPPQAAGAPPQAAGAPPQAAGAPPQAAGAPPARAVHFQSAGCDAVSSREVAAALRVELAGRLVERAPSADDELATLDCGGTSASLSIAAPGAPERKRRVNLAPVQRDIRARVVALAIAELVRDIDEENVPPPPPPRPPPAPAAPPERSPREAPVAREPSADEAPTLGAFAQASAFGAGGGWLVGGGIRFDYAGRWWCAGLDAAALTLTERFAPGSADAVVAYAGPYAGWRAAWGAVQARAGGGVALGVARLAGHAEEPGAFSATTTGPWTAPYAFAALRVRVMGPAALEARGRLGWVTSPVIGEVASGGQMALEGVWASAELGIALAL
jgi:hypothetical protein